MKKTIYILGFIVTTLIISLPCYALEWAMTYGGSDPTQLNHDTARSVKQTLDGGYIVTGTKCFSCEDEGTNLWMLRLDSYGRVTWEKTYPTTSYQGGGYAVQQTSDGGYVAAGLTKVLKLNADGSVDWNRIYSANVDEIQETLNQDGNPDGYVVAGGVQPSQFWIAKLNSDGTILWEKSYGGNRTDSTESVQQTFDQYGNPNGYILAGYTFSFNAESDEDPWIENAWLLRLDANGNVGPEYPGTWQKTYGTNNWEEAASVQQTFNEQGIPSGYIVAGTILYDSGQERMWVLKLNSSGDVEWQKTYAGTGSRPSYGYAIQQIADGHYVVAGHAWVSENRWDTWVLKLNSYGNVVWHKTFDKSLVTDMEQTQDDGYVLAGWTRDFGADSSDFIVLKLDANGEIPNCGLSRQGSAVVSNSQAVAVDTSATSPQLSTTVDSEVVTPQDTSALTGLLCSTAPQCSVMPHNYDFGDVVLGTPGVACVTILNYGESDLTVSDISFEDGSSGDYVITSVPSLPAVLQPWTSVDVEITFTPSVLGMSAATLETTSDDPYEPVVEVDFSGNGVNIPVANFTVDPNSGTAPLRVQFADQSTGSVTSWFWNFGDGGTSTLQNPPYTYTNAGDFTVSLTVTGSGGEDTEVKQNYIHVSPLCECDLVPDDIPVVIPRGGTLGFQASVSNNTDLSGSVYFATKVKLPSGNMYPPSGFFDGPFQLWMDHYGSRSGHLSHNTSGWPVGPNYIYRGLVGIPDVALFDVCEFGFEVIDSLPDSPVINSINPVSGPCDTVIEITGDYFGDLHIPANRKVIVAPIGDVASQYQLSTPSWTNTRIEAQFPCLSLSPGDYYIAVYTEKGWSNIEVFTLVAP